MLRVRNRMDGVTSLCGYKVHPSSKCRLWSQYAGIMLTERWSLVNLFVTYYDDLKTKSIVNLYHINYLRFSGVGYVTFYCNFAIFSGLNKQIILWFV